MLQVRRILERLPSGYIPDIKDTDIDKDESVDTRPPVQPPQDVCQEAYVFKDLSGDYPLFHKGTADL